MRQSIKVNVNGVDRQSEVEPRMLLVQYLREGLNLTGTHIGCDTGQCGACTVLLNGQAVKSCMVLAVQADGAQVQTVERLETERCNITRCRRPSGRSTVCNAASAPPAS